jgi:glutaconate CoA-transferase subunit B
MEHDRRRLRERVDFITSPGYGDGPGWRQQVGLQGGGPAALITTLAVFRFDQGEAVLHSYHPFTSQEEIAANTGWKLVVTPDLRPTPEPTAEELAIIREYDPRGFWTGAT